jgi:hypothetical protein
MKKSVLIVLALLGGALMFSGCKNNDGGGAPACQAGYVWMNNQCVPNGTFPGGLPGGGYGMCPVGQVQTQYGCLAQGSCQPGSGQYQPPGQPTPICVPGTMTGQFPGQYPNGYLGGQYPNGGLYGTNPYGSVYNQYPYQGYGLSPYGGYGSYNTNFYMYGFVGIY